MKRIVRFYSTQENGSSTEPQSFFETTVEVKPSSKPLLKGSLVPAVCIAPNCKHHRLKEGTITHVKEENDTQWICVGTPTPPQSFKDCLREAKLYQEVIGSPK